MNRSLLFIFLILLPLFGNCRSMEVGVSADGNCVMPYPQFKFNYLDSLIRQSKRPTDSEFLKGVSKRMDQAKEEIYLWYLLRNKKLAKSFFDKMQFKDIVNQNEDSLNSILWIMVNTNTFFPEEFVASNADSFKKLDLWSSKYRVENPGRYLAMKFYTKDNYSNSDLAKIDLPPGDVDVDVLIRLGVMSENNNRGLDALYYYTKAAAYGYQGGLVGAAIRLPVEGGDRCIQRAAYYILLSGATGPAIWWTR